MVSDQRGFFFLLVLRKGCTPCVFHIIILVQRKTPGGAGTIVVGSVSGLAVLCVELQGLDRMAYRMHANVLSCWHTKCGNGAGKPIGILSWRRLYLFCLHEARWEQTARRNKKLFWSRNVSGVRALADER